MDIDKVEGGVRSRTPAFPVARGYVGSIPVCCSPPGAKVPIRDVPPLVYKRALCVPGPALYPLFTLRSSPPQADGGQPSDGARSDSDLEARLNSWNLGVSLGWPGAPGGRRRRWRRGSEPRSRPRVLPNPLTVKSCGEWESGCVNLAFEYAGGPLIARVKRTGPDWDKHPALMPLYSVILFPISPPA